MLKPPPSLVALDNCPVSGVPRCPACLTRPRWWVSPRWDGTLPLPAPGESGDVRIVCSRCGRGANGPRVYIRPRMPLNHRRNMLRLQALRWTWRALRDRPEWAERGGETARKELQRCGSAGGTSC